MSRAVYSVVSRALYKGSVGQCSVGLQGSVEGVCRAVHCGSAGQCSRGQ